MLGGWILQASSYTVLFGITALVLGGGLVLALTLKPLRAARA
jgi:hypothetical protein